MLKKIAILAMAGAVALVSACDRGGYANNEPRQDPDLRALRGSMPNNSHRVCLIDDPNQIDRCVIGETLYALTGKDNEQKLSIFLAAHCNLDKAVVYNESGVICEYMPHSVEVAAKRPSIYTYRNNKQFLSNYFKKLSQIPGIEKISSDFYDKEGGYVLFLTKAQHSDSEMIRPGKEIIIESSRIYYDGSSSGFAVEDYLADDKSVLYPAFKLLGKGDHARIYLSLNEANVEVLSTGNHSEIGLPVIFDIKVLEVREPSKEFIEQQRKAAAAAEAARQQAEQPQEAPQGEEQNNSESK
ncbi:MAG: hypothetical protein IJ228_11110 [Succinivibrio sp.]|nr:hypothetical protein [Succinivibrio sp.]